MVQLFLTTTFWSWLGIGIALLFGVGWWYGFFAGAIASLVIDLGDDGPQSLTEVKGPLPSHYEPGDYYDPRDVLPPFVDNEHDYS